MIIKITRAKSASTLLLITLLFVSALIGVLTVMPEEANAIDDALPVIRIEAPTNGQNFKTATITVSGIASDDVGVDKVEVKIGSGDWELADLNLGFPVIWSKSVTLSAGSNTITARATDAADNIKEASVTVTYNPPDTTPPTITISTPTDGQEVTTQSITISGTASDDKGVSKVEIQVGSGSWQVATGTSPWSKSVTLSAGSNTITARATDAAGNIKEASVTVTCTPDTTLPTIRIEAPTNGQNFKTATITVSGIASDDVGVDKVEVKIGSGDWELADLNLGFPVIWSKSVTLSAGSNTITARATDAAGNTKEASVTVTYNRETTDNLPTITISTPTDGQEVTTPGIAVSGTASDDKGVSKVEIQVGSGSWQVATGTSTWSKSVTLAAGANTITARATDTAGNIKEASVTVTYNPPDTLPTISISASTNGQEIGWGDKYILDLCEHEVNGTYLADGVHEAKMYVVLRDKGTRRLAEAPSTIKVIIRSENSTAKPSEVNISEGGTKSEDISLTSIRPSIACVRAEAIGFEVATSYVEFVPSTIPSELLLEAHPKIIPANGRDSVDLTVKLLCPDGQPFKPPQDTKIDMWTSTGKSFNLTLSAEKGYGRGEFKTYKDGTINITAKSYDFEVGGTTTVTFISVVTRAMFLISFFGGVMGGAMYYYGRHLISEPKKQFVILAKQDDLKDNNLGIIYTALFHGFFGLLIYFIFVLCAHTDAFVSLIDRLTGIPEIGQLLSQLPLDVGISVFIIGFIGGMFSIPIYIKFLNLLEKGGP
jgi:hypothetical protein